MIFCNLLYTTMHRCKWKGKKIPYTYKKYIFSKVSPKGFHTNTHTHTLYTYMHVCAPHKQHIYNACTYIMYAHIYTSIQVHTHSSTHTSYNNVITKFDTFILALDLLDLDQIISMDLINYYIHHQNKYYIVLY